MVDFSAVGRRLLQAPGASLLLGGLERLGTWPPGRLCTLTYHRVTEMSDDGRHPGLISATPVEFEQHLDVLEERYNIVSLDMVLAARAGRGALPPNAVLLTFDDAVDDFVDHTLPTLLDRAVPAVLFVPTGFVDRDDAWFWWDAVHAAVMKTERSSLPGEPIGSLPLLNDGERSAAFGELRNYFKQIPWSRTIAEVSELTTALGVVPPPADVMGWADVRKAAEAGIAVCPHTRTHPHLDQLGIDEVRGEIAGSLDDLREHLGTVPSAFAYPSGQWTPDVRAVVDELGFELAFTTRRAAHDLGSADPLLIGRFNVSRRTGMNALRLQMLPWSDRLQRSDHRVHAVEGARGSLMP
ncbi:MAG: polysaccharide deacetylase family protein [Acidimicrobiia bacterium]|nr:polysaccharide deacetylase family protein [Acidimicrobiia bacterium]